MQNQVSLRDVLPDDLPTLYEHQANPEWVRMTGFPARSREDFMAHWAKILANPYLVKKTIMYADQIAGSIVCFGEPGEREVGYGLDQALWGKGIATQALTAFLEEIKLRPLIAHVAKHNPASLRVLQKCGFTITGEDRWAPPGGEMMDEWVLKKE